MLTLNKLVSNAHKEAYYLKLFESTWLIRLIYGLQASTWFGAANVLFLISLTDFDLDRFLSSYSSYFLPPTSTHTISLSDQPLSFAISSPARSPPSCHYTAEGRGFVFGAFLLAERLSGENTSLCHFLFKFRQQNYLIWFSRPWFWLN